MTKPYEITPAQAVPDTSAAPTGRLVVFEGPDGVGKTTISAHVATALAAGGIDVELLTFPGKEPGTLGHLVYEVHHDTARFGIGEMTPSAKQALHLAAHLDAIERRIVPALRAGRHVLLDRFWWSTWVYGVVGGMALPVLEAMIAVERAQWGAVLPAVAVVIRRDSPIDREGDRKTWHALRDEYDALAAREVARHPVATVVNMGSLAETVVQVLAVLEAHGVPPRPPATPASDSHGPQGCGPSDAPLASPTLVASPPPPGAGAPRRAAQRRGMPAKSDSRSTQLAIGLVLDSDVPKPAAPHVVVSHLAPARITAVYDTYWRFAAERQRVFFRRLARAAPPWTGDPILGTYKFTNAYRASDRVSQYLIRHVIYRDDLPSSTAEVCFRILLFKLFNKIETWQLLEEEVGALTYGEYQFARYDGVLTRAMQAGRRIYSAAYIMPPGGNAFGHPAKHQNHLRLLEHMMRDELPQRLAGARTMQRAFELLRAYPTIGDFLAYQFVTDVNYSEVTDFGEMDFVVPGPGALDGIRKCFADTGGLNEPELIRLMAETQDAEFTRLGLVFQSLWGRPLQLIDCQNLFCEVDKYARVHHPDATGRSGRTRIKQKYVSSGQPIAYWYPPKWNLNHLVEAGPYVSAVAPDSPEPIEGA